MDGDSQRTSAVASLVSSGHELKTILEKTGRTARDINGLDKLDLLNLIVEQIKEKIECRGRMNLKLSDLNVLLNREGLKPEGSAQEAIKALLRLRGIQLARIGNYSRFGSISGDPDGEFAEALMIMPSHEVDECFVADDWSPSKLDVTTPVSRIQPIPEEMLEDTRTPTSAERLDPALVREQAYPGVSIKPPVHAPLKTSGQQLRQILEKTGYAVRGLGIVEKLDLLDLIVEQVMEKIQLRRHMQVSISQLQSLLFREGLPVGEDSRATIQQLIKLRHMQLLRASSYVRLKSKEDSRSIISAGHDFSYSLLTIPTEEIDSCFATDAVPVRIDYPSPIFAAPGADGSFAEEERTAEKWVTSDSVTATSPGQTTLGGQSFINSDLEAKVSDLTARLNQAEARASLAEEKARVLSLQTALERAEARAAQAEERAAAAEERADMLESRLAALQSSPKMQTRGAYPRLSQSKPDSTPVTLTRDTRNCSTEVPSAGSRIKSSERSCYSVEVPTGTRVQSPDRSIYSVEVPVGANRIKSPDRATWGVEVPTRVKSPERSASVRKQSPDGFSSDAHSSKARIKPPLPDAASGRGTPVYPCSRRAEIKGRPLFVNFQR
jgi:hypothetical protein